MLRIWRAFGLQPHRQQTRKLSKDPQFVATVRDVVGLYLNPPERATHDYKRSETSSLYAALDITTGKVISSLHSRHRAIEFKKFLRTLEREVPDELEVHLVLDNSSMQIDQTGILRITSPGGCVLCNSTGMVQPSVHRNLTRGMKMRRGFTLGFAIGLAVLTMGPSAAQATFPGKNGRILTATLGCTVKDCSPVPFMLSFNPDGSQLASFPGTDRFGGVFSPDGTKVAYFSASPLTVGAPNYVVTVSAPDGSGQQQLLPTAVTGWSQLGAFSTRLSWLPDGKHLTYDGPEGTLWETDLTGLTQPVLLLPNKPGVYLAGVSPDGKQVAYVDTNGSTLYVASFPLGLDAHPIATYPAGISAPQWSPDSKQLIFSTGQTRQIIETAADGTNVRTVGSGALPTWSPDGKSIAFGDPVNNGHMIANTDGSNPQTFPGIINIGADWQALP